MDEIDATQNRSNDDAESKSSDENENVSKIIISRFLIAKFRVYFYNGENCLIIDLLNVNSISPSNELCPSFYV